MTCARRVQAGTVVGAATGQRTSRSEDRRGQHRTGESTGPAVSRTAVSSIRAAARRSKQPGFGAIHEVLQQ